MAEIVCASATFPPVNKRVEHKCEQLFPESKSLVTSALVPPSAASRCCCEHLLAHEQASERTSGAEGTAGGGTRVQVGSAPSVPQPEEFQTRHHSDGFFVCLFNFLFSIEHLKKIVLEGKGQLR